MQKIALALLIICLYNISYSQIDLIDSKNATIKLEPETFVLSDLDENHSLKNGYSTKVQVPIKKMDSEFISFSISWRHLQSSALNSTFYIRGKEKTNEWENWKIITIDHHNEGDEDIRYSNLMFFEKDYQELEIFVLGADVNTFPQNIKLHFYNPTKSQINTNTKKITQSRAGCQCLLSAYESRTDWCDNCPIGSNATPTDVSHIVIHHSASSNSATDWAAAVRSFWNFHVNVKGWDDIGYNWLIDPNGKLYVGRADNIKGAHYCGKNSNTMGICMIGTFTDVAPTQQAKTTLAQLLAWKTCKEDIEPLGSSFHPSTNATLTNIIGHRNGCSTECPGNTFYPLIPTIKQNAVNIIENDCESTATTETSNIQELKVYPNPSNGIINLDIQNVSFETGHIYIINLTSKIIWENNAKNYTATDKTIRLDIGSIPQGIYILVLKLQDQLIRKTIVKY
ncbi:MAG: N-acetylmuramoyl-L-alanine amidase [Saprospiraceae bacterium]